MCSWRQLILWSSLDVLTCHTVSLPCLNNSRATSAGRVRRLAKIQNEWCGNLVAAIVRRYTYFFKPFRYILNKFERDNSRTRSFQFAFYSMTGTAEWFPRWSELNPDSPDQFKRKWEKLVCTGVTSARLKFSHGAFLKCDVLNSSANGIRI